jgi:hypothetical protein
MDSSSQKDSVSHLFIYSILFISFLQRDGRSLMWIFTRPLMALFELWKFLFKVLHATLFFKTPKVIYLQLWSVRQILFKIFSISCQMVEIYQNFRARFYKKTGTNFTTLAVQLFCQILKIHFCQIRYPKTLVK